MRNIINILIIITTTTTYSAPDATVESSGKVQKAQSLASDLADLQ